MSQAVTPGRAYKNTDTNTDIETNTDSNTARKTNTDTWQCRAREKERKGKQLSQAVTPGRTHTDRCRGCLREKISLEKKPAKF